MALIKCKECGATISDKAEFCPHCGCPLKDMGEGVHTEEQSTSEDINNVAGCQAPQTPNTAEGNNSAPLSSVEETIRANRQIQESESPYSANGEGGSNGGGDLPPKKDNPYKWLYIIGAIVAVLLVAIIIILVTGNKEGEGTKNDSDSTAADSEIVISSNIDTVAPPTQPEEEEPQTPEEQFAAATSDDNPEVVAGNYTFTDGNGDTWQLTVKANKTAILVNTNGDDNSKVYYSWYKYGTMGYAQLRCSDTAPSIQFPGGEKTADRICFNLSNVYYSSSACEANDPNLSLPLSKK